MSSLKILLPILAALAPPCSSFAPSIPSVSRSSIGTDIRPPCVLRAAPGDSKTNNIPGDDTEPSNIEYDALGHIGKTAGSALVALTLSFSAITAPLPFSTDGLVTSIPSANAAVSPSSIMIAAGRNSKSPPSEDDVIIKELEQETRAVEREAKADRRKAKIELSREKFFEYEARMAEQQEARIEDAEQRAEAEFEKDKVEAEKLKALEEKAEREAALAQTKEEKLAKQKEARALLKKEKEIERKEKKALRAEKIFLAEEEQERKILQQKEDAAFAEEKKYEEVEKEFETVAELAKEEEMELSLLKGLKGLSSKK